MRKLDKKMKTILDASIEGLYMTDDAMEKKLEALPDVPDLAHRLDHPDATFDAWRNRQDKRAWVRLDLSALRIGYELGLCAGKQPNARNNLRESRRDERQVD